MKEEYDKRQRLAAAEAQLRKEREDHQREREELQQEREAQLRKEREEHQREREAQLRKEREEHQRERDVLQRQVIFTFLLNATNANMTHRYRMPRQEWNVFPKRWR